MQGLAPKALLFPSAGDPTRHLTASSFHKTWIKAMREAGVEGLHVHDLRHLGATLAAATGATLRELMQRLGHSTSTAALRYQHAAEDRDRAIAEAMSGFAAGNVVPLRRSAG
ncbi:MAG: tyrosine-type recombinase/integrase [Actinomycetota bacterium]|nr:tyrosine-type recombinase/integrase [Actinomycetota bacterium]